MNSLRSWGSAAFPAALAAWLAVDVAGAKAQPVPGKNEVQILTIEGKGEVLSAGANRWLPAATNLVLHAGDHVRTGLNSRMTLRWSDQSVVPVGALTELEILPPNDARAQCGLHLLRGILSFFHRDAPGRIRVITRGGVAGVEGTEFAIAVDPTQTPEQTKLWVIDGRVRLSNEQGTVILTNNEAATAQEGKAPLPSAGFVANNVLQWCLYYPAVLDLAELPLSAEEQSALSDSVTAYRGGDLLAALSNYPAARQPGSDAERVFYAALALSVGQVDTAEQSLTAISAADISARVPRLAGALRTLIAAVKRQQNPTTTSPQLATELLAASYYAQSLAKPRESLEQALALAQRATVTSPEFGFAWARVAELEFSFGRSGPTLSALERSLALTPRNAEALALKGFVLAGQNKARAALNWFDQALAIDSGLGDAWVGRGLCRIRLGDVVGGRQDLLVAAAREPQRAVLRSYLGKAYAAAGENELAAKELGIAKRLDPSDPTAWLYSALFKEQQNRINEAVGDLERSEELNDNRRLYRSELLLDQDRAVRSANLARIYSEAGLQDVALQEASRGVTADYANYSAHLFLANSYDQLRNDNRFDLRFETPAFNEYLLASLLGPADGRLLAQPVSQQEYTRLFERDTLGLSTDTEYLSRGAWNQYAAQYGTFGSTSYALEGNYLSDRGETPNGGIESWEISLKAKQMLTPRDGLFFQILDFHETSGDLAQRYDPNQAVLDLTRHEKQEPTLLAGFDHQWNENNRTLLLASHFNSSLEQTNAHDPVFLITETFGVPDGFFRQDLSQEFHSRLIVDSLELQHILRISRFQTIAGFRVQSGSDHLSNLQVINPGNSPGYEIYFGNSGDVVTNQSLQIHSLRLSPYLYEYWQVLDSLLLLGGVSYDYQELPRNTLFAPIGSDNQFQNQLSPKAGLVWTPLPHATLRAAYSQSLGGFDLDQSVRLEPTQLAGFAQVYRNLFPDSIVGSVGGAHFETGDAAITYRFPTRTYVTAAAQLLRSHSDHDVGAFQRDLFTSQGPAVQINERLRFEERSLDFSAHQLLADWFSLGARYRISDAWLSQTYPDVNPALGTTSITYRGLLHSLSLQGLCQLPCGFFAGVEGAWWAQTLRDDLANVPGDSFWQENFLAGWRSPRRYAEITMGVLNLSGENYHLFPINLYPDLPRSRTFFVRLQLNF